MDGKIKITLNILTIAPLAINVQSELIISMLEYKPTPKVAAKNVKALTTMDFALVWQAIATASLFPAPASRSLRYLVVINIA